MTSHPLPVKGKGSKNINIARNVGIACAKSWFERMLDPEMQAFMFDWNKPNIFGIDHLFIYFSNTPKNLDELKTIAYESAEIEFHNQKEEYLKNNETLPIKKYSDEECIQQFVDMLTNSHIMLSQIDFQNEKREDKKVNKNWKKEYLKEVTVDSLKESAIQRAKDAISNKRLSSNIEEQVIEKLNSYYNGITNLSEKLYTPR